MHLTTLPVNIFVFGDLVLDHYIPITDKPGPFQKTASEDVYAALPRRTIAGGAANCARVTAALGHGRTCLWGLSGHSPWGSFVEFVRRSNASDRADRGLIYYGSHNDSHPMNTITRIVYMEPAGNRVRKLRLDDIPMLPVTETQRHDAIGYLRAETEEHHVHAVILNDLDMKSLTEPLISEIGEFANKNNIPLFVDPKREWIKYRKLKKITAALPNLEEWCSIVNESKETWRAHITHNISLGQMAEKCLRHMPNVEFHIITCDDLGVILIMPSDPPGHHTIYHIEAHPTLLGSLPGQLGAGDILVGALALEYAGLMMSEGLGNEADRSKGLLDCLWKAQAVTACYLGLDWHQIPNEREIQKFDLQTMKISNIQTVDDAVLLLPPREFRLDSIEIRGSGLVSTDEKGYRASIEEMLAFLVEDWDKLHPASVVITGPGGVGKSELVSMLSETLAKMHVPVWILDPKLCKDNLAALQLIEQKWAEVASSATGLLVVVDEAFSKAAHLLLGERGKNLLQDVSPKTRFIFIDADFDQHKGELSRSQFMSRIKLFELPALSSRLPDIPYIFAASCVKLVESGSVRISEAVLISVIRKVLKDPDGHTGRDIYNLADDAVKKAKADQAFDLNLPTITLRYLPASLQIPEVENPRTLHQFSWSIARRRAARAGTGS